MPPSSLDASLQLAIQLHQANRLSEAEQAYRRVLAQQPDQPSALHLLGVLAAQTGRPDAAVDLIRRALQVQPDYAEAHHNLGNALRATGRHDEAVAAFRQAIALNPHNAESHVNLGQLLGHLDYLDDAIAALSQAVRLNPAHAPAHYYLGFALHKVGRLDDAIASFRRAIAAAPTYSEAYNDLGVALSHKNLFDEAAVALRQAIAFNPNYAEAYNNLGNVLRTQGRFAESLAACRKAVALRPQYAEAHNNMGNDLRNAQRFDAAVTAFRQAIALQPDLAEPYNNLGNTFKDLGRLDEAIAAFRRAIELRPEATGFHSNLLYTFIFHPGYSAAQILQEHRAWAHRHAAPLAVEIQPHANDRSPDRRLRIGYVSPDFRGHVVAHSLAPVLAAHDHQAVEVFCYSDVVRPDEITPRFQATADVWRNIAGQSDAAVADIIRHDHIDILLDLTMHMRGNRSLLFARKPAPVQICWAAYPGTTGLDTMDYRLTDPYLDPVTPNDGIYSEESLRLPDSFWCYDPLTEAPAVNELPALRNGYVTFGCLNNFCKVNPEVLRLWARVLRAVENSRLILMTGQGSSAQAVLDTFKAEGIEPARIAMVEFVPRRDYLETYHRIDLSLDTFPYNGHNTSLDGLWMGVPTVSLLGQTVVGRAGLSQLTNIGLPELATATADAFVDTAVRLARDLPRLAALRRELRGRLQRSPIMNATRFAKNLEAAYRDVWRRWCESD